MRANASLWFWRSVWGIILLAGLMTFGVYAWLPADGATGDLESFASAGFRVQWLLEEREAGLRVGDVIVRAGGHTADEWLSGAPRGPEWRTGGIVTYEILRDGQPMTLPIRLAPVSFGAVLAHWGLQLAVSVALIVVGSFVLWKRPPTLTARVFMLFCISVAVQLWGDAYNVQYAVLPWRWLFWLHLLREHGTFVLNYASICHFALIFPSPSPLVKRFPRLLPLVLYASNPLAMLLAMVLSPTWSRALPLGNHVSMVVPIVQVGLAIGASIRSVRVARDPVSRAQIRWILLSAGLAIAVAFPAYLLPLALGRLPLIPHPVVMLLTIFIPYVIAIAILRYHLFDIEVIINRTLVYGTLTLLLGGLYLVVVRLLTLVVQAVLHRGNEPLVVFIAALSIALAFAPLRQRVQALIDRAYYRTRLDYQRLLSEMSERLATSIVLEQLSALLTQELPQQLQIASAALAVLDPRGEQFALAGGNARFGVLPASHPLAGYLHGQGHPLLRLQPPSDLPPEVEAFLNQHGIELCIPLIVGAELVGLYNLGPKLSGDAYSRYEVRLLHLLGQQAAVAVENSRLFRVEREERMLTEALQEAAAVVSSTLDLDQVLDSILEQVERVVVGDAFNIMRIEGDHIQVIRWRGYQRLNAADRVADLSIPLASYPALSEMMRTGKPVVVPDTATHAGWVPAAGWEWLRSYVAAPIRVGDRTVGFLNVDSTQPGRFGPTDARRLKAFADYAATAIQNARLYQELRRQAEELEGAVAQLQELGRLKGEFIQNVSHELRSPLALIRGYAEVLEAGELGQLQPEQQRSVSIIARRAQMLGDLVAGITLILEAEFNPPKPEPVPLGDLAQSTVEDFQIAAEGAGLTLRADISSPLAPVRGCPIYLRRVLDNLLGNAVKFTRAGGTITLRVWQREAQVVLEVADTGIGIPPDKQERVFERFYQVDGSARRRYGGVGLGLALVKEIVEAYGGHVTVESGVGEGSTFAVTLPVYEG